MTLLATPCGFIYPATPMGAEHGPANPVNLPPMPPLYERIETDTVIYFNDAGGR